MLRPVSPARLARVRPRRFRATPAAMEFSMVVSPFRVLAAVDIDDVLTLVAVVIRLGQFRRR